MPFEKERKKEGRKERDFDARAVDDVEAAAMNRCLGACAIAT